MDAIHYNVRCEGMIVKKAVYIAIGINMDGKKDVLGMYVGENESARYWLSILNGLKKLKILTGSCGRSQKTGLYSRTMTACLKCST